MWWRARRRSAVGLNTGDEDGIHSAMAAPPGAPATQPAMFGRLEEFSTESGTFSAYLERVMIFFAANGISGDKQVPVFFSTIGATTYSTLRDLLAPPFVELTAALKTHYEPKTLVIVKRYHFHKRYQGAGESISEYVAELRRLASKFRFEAYLDQALRDRFVCGLRSEAIQKRLLTEENLTIARAEVAHSMEAAHKNAQAMKPQAVLASEVVEPSPPPEEQPMHRVGGSYPRGGHMQPTGGCYRCGNTTHRGQDCTQRYHLPQVWQTGTPGQGVSQCTQWWQRW